MERWPDFFIAGAPKAGTTALHAALVGVPGIALSTPKEPKFFLCDGTPPARTGSRGGFGGGGAGRGPPPARRGGPLFGVPAGRRAAGPPSFFCPPPPPP